MTFARLLLCCGLAALAPVIGAQQQTRDNVAPVTATGTAALSGVVSSPSGRAWRSRLSTRTMLT